MAAAGVAFLFPMDSNDDVDDKIVAFGVLPIMIYIPSL